MIYSFCDSENKRQGGKKKAQKHEGTPYNDRNLKKNWASGDLAQSHICQVHCFSVIIQLCFLPLGCSSWLPGPQTSTHYPREGTSCCGTGSSPGLVAGLDTTQSSGSAFSSIFYRIPQQVNFRPVSRWALQGFSFTGITEAKGRKGGSAFSSKIEQHRSFRVPLLVPEG